MLIVYAENSSCQWDLPNFSMLSLYHNSKIKGVIHTEFLNSTNIRYTR